MKCEACGGDGLIEVGAYRGDEDDLNTRECRLCGGVVTLNVWRESVSGERSTKQIGSAAEAAQKLTQPAHVSSETGVRIKDFVVASGASAVQPPPSRSQTPQDIAREYAQRLNEQNEREQIAAEMNKVIRGLK